MCRPGDYPPYEDEAPPPLTEAELDAFYAPIIARLEAAIEARRDPLPTLADIEAAEPIEAMRLITKREQMLRAFPPCPNCGQTKWEGLGRTNAKCRWCGFTVSR